MPAADDARATANRRMLGNALSQMAGRVFLSLARLGVAAIVVRCAGAERFGEYALVLSFLLIAEWLVDFGMTEIGVRDICRDPARRAPVLRALVLSRAAQAALAALLLPALLFILDYPPPVVRAGVVGAAAVLCYAGALAYRALFRVEMKMGRDVLAEVLGVVVMIPLTWYAAANGGGVDALIACYAVSRAVFLAAAVFLGRGGISLAPAPAARADALKIFRDAAPLGLIGLLVCAYDNLSTVLLAALADMQSVAHFAGALRFVLPVVILIQAIGAAVYPALAAGWKTDRPGFTGTQQAALDSAVLIAAGFFCVLNAAAEFLMRLLGPEMEAGASVLRLLSWTVLARSVTTIMSPLIIIAGGQSRAFRWTLLSVLCNLALLLWLIPRYGIAGAAAAYIVTEFLVSMAPIVWLGQSMTGIRLRWLPACKLMLAALAALWASHTLAGHGSAGAGMLAFVCYLLFAAIAGALPLRALRRMLAGVKGRLAPGARAVEAES